MYGLSLMEWLGAVAVGLIVVPLLCLGAYALCVILMVMMN